MRRMVGTPRLSDRPGGSVLVESCGRIEGLGPGSFVSATQTHDWAVALLWPLGRSGRGRKIRTSAFLQGLLLEQQLCVPCTGEGLQHTFATTDGGVKRLDFVATDTRLVLERCHAEVVTGLDLMAKRVDICQPCGRSRPAARLPGPMFFLVAVSLPAAMPSS